MDSSLLFYFSHAILAVLGRRTKACNGNFNGIAFKVPALGQSAYLLDSDSVQHLWRRKFESNDNKPGNRQPLCPLRPLCSTLFH